MSHLVTVAQLRAYKRSNGEIYALSAFSDAELQACLDEAEELVEKITGTRYWESNETWYLDGQDSHYLRFTPIIGYPLLSATELLEVDENGAEIEEWVENEDFVNNGHYLLAVDVDDSARVGTIVSNGYFPAGVKNFKLTGVWGECRTADVPEALKRVIKLLALETVAPGLTGASKSDVQSEEWPDYKVSYRSGSEKVATATGFKELDRILHRYTAGAAMFLHDEHRQYKA